MAGDGTLAKRGKRVLILVQNLPLPFDRRVWLESRALRDAGYAVTVICPKGFNYTKSHEVIEGIRIYRYLTFEAGARRIAFVAEFFYCWIRTVLLALWVAAVHGFDVIHACNPPDTFWVIAMLFRPLGKRFIFDQHDLCPELYLEKYPTRAGDRMHRGLLFLERRTYKLADAVIATNGSYRDIAIERGEVDPNHVFIVRSGPDGDRVQLVDPDPTERNGAAYLLAYLGTMGVQDGVDGLLRVMKVLVDKLGRKDIHLKLVGGGSQLEQLREMARGMGLDPYVTFTGRVPDGDRFKRIFCSADICISPDPPGPLNNVSTMNKTIEYMGFGRPVVAYALKETMVSGGEAAVYATPGDEEEMARKIVDLLADPARRELMGRIGRDRVERELCWKHSVPPLLKAYECALQRC